MIQGGPRYSQEEFARRGESLFATAVKPLLKKKDNGRYVAIDIETGEWEISDDEMEVIELLRCRVDDPQPWLKQVGSSFLRSYGGRGVSSGSSK